MKIVYRVENLDCPHCAAEIEKKIQGMEGISSASLSLAAGTLHLEAESEDGLLEKIQAAADSIEDGVIISEKRHRKSSHAHSHCECGSCHDHHDHTHHEEQHGHSHGNTGKCEIVILAVGAGLFLLGMLAEFLIPVPHLSKALLLAAYLIMGWEVLWSSVKSIGKGQIFDENFLMSVATIGALCIGYWEEAAGVMLFFRIGELFEHIAVERSRKSVMEAIDLRPETVLRLQGDATETIPAEEISVGDMLLVRAGDRIPVDGIIRKGESSLDTSAMTGESVPVNVRTGDQVMSGCINVSGVLEMEATAALEDSMVTRILDSVENAAAGKPKIDRFITRFARIYTPIVVGIAVLTAIVPSLITGEWGHWIYTALNFLMISCPCALVLSVPLAFFSGIGAGSRKGILFKDGISLEVLTKIRAVVMDKTGTLTNGSFSVKSVHAVDCSMQELLKVCAACESASSHPIAKSILEYAAQEQIEFRPAQEVREIAGKGILAVYGGKQIVCGNAAFLEECGISVCDPKLSGTQVHVAADGKYLGCLILSDLPKQNAGDVVAAMKKKGLYTVMLTGDSADHAKEIAAQLQIDETHAGLLPTDKPEYMQKIRKEHGSVLFVGDGINDAPVLSGADVGAAMGSGADAAMEAADVVFLTSDPQAILTSIDIAECVNRTSRFNIAFALAVKFLIMILGFAGFANMWLSIFADTGVTVLCVLFVIWNVHFRYRKC